jgi:TRAP-type C4-dicarboxylate transport system permease small subunit
MTIYGIGMIKLEQVFSTIDRLSFYSARISQVGMLTMAGLIVFTATKRFFGHAPLWADEISTYLLEIVILFGMSYTLLLDRHMRIDIIFVRLPYRVQTILNIITSILTLLFFAVLIWKGTSLTAEHYVQGARTYTNMRTPLWYTEIMIPIAGFMMFIQILSKIYRYLRSLVKPNELNQKLERTSYE